MRTSRFMRVLCMLAVFALVAIVLSAAPSTAQAYGKDALWQIGLSANCNNPDFCGSLGGFWGWVEFDSGGQGDATITGCEHLTAAGPVHVAGADHFNIEITGWTIAPGSAGPATFFVTSEEDTITGGTGGPPITIIIPSEYFDTGIPAVPGHYNTSQLLGFTAPGVAFQIQVVQLTH